MRDNIGMALFTLGFLVFFLVPACGEWIVLPAMILLLVGAALATSGEREY